jgi:hypothetical protein
MSKDDEEWNAPNMRGLDFLDTIPEDASVTAARAAALSTASAVASSDDGEGPIERRRATAPSEMGQSVVSETPGVLGGDTSDQQHQQAPNTADSTASRKCTLKTFMFYIILSFMLAAVAVGIYYIAAGSDDDEIDNPSMQAVGPSQTPSEEEPALAPFDTTFLESESPTTSPSYNPQDMMDLDQALLRISTAQDLEDPDTPQAICSHWLSHKDGQSLRVSETGPERIFQRYVLCTLYYATNGDEWIEGFLDGTLHECDWNGVYCEGNNTNVTIVDLPEANLVGSLPEELIYLEQLQGLILYGNSLTGTLPSQLFELPLLVWFDLANNELEGPIPTPRSDSLLEVLNLKENQFSGTLPFFPQLQEMVVYSNGFDQIDSRYTTLESLKLFVANDNLLVGKLPEKWDAQNLSYLDLHSNFLTGTIPVAIWSLPSLESLVLHVNQLNGALPSKTGNSFEHVWLQSNILSGSIPQSFGANWVNLTSMLLYDNQLSGTVDMQCPGWSQLQRLETDCTVSCQCCTAECK